MKKLSLVSLLVVCIFTLSLSANATGLRNEFRNYEITSVDDLYLGKNVEKVWTLSYSTNETPITVVKQKSSEGDVYVVHSKYFDVCYASTANGFGAKEVRNAWCSVPKKITKAVISQEELKRQEIITPKKVDDERALGLIASYLPDLINDSYTHLLN
jgi:hypothetical protein